MDNTRIFTPLDMVVEVAPMMHSGCITIAERIFNLIDRDKEILMEYKRTGWAGDAYINTALQSNEAERRYLISKVMVRIITLAQNGNIIAKGYEISNPTSFVIIPPALWYSLALDFDTRRATREGMIYDGVCFFAYPQDELTKILQEVAPELSLEPAIDPTSQCTLGKESAATGQESLLEKLPSVPFVVLTDSQCRGMLEQIANAAQAQPKPHTAETQKSETVHANDVTQTVLEETTTLEQPELVKNYSSQESREQVLADWLREEKDAAQTRGEQFDEYGLRMVKKSIHRELSERDPRLFCMTDNTFDSFWKIQKLCAVKGGRRSAMAV